jgi:hypothetical protein
MSEERGHDLTPRDLAPRERQGSGAILLAVVLGVALAGSAAAELGRLDAAERGQVRAGEVLVIRSSPTATRGCSSAARRSRPSVGSRRCRSSRTSRSRIGFVATAGS